MRKEYTVILLILLLCITTGGCMVGFESVRGSGTQTYIERPETGFKELEFGYGCNATITSGETYSVVIQIDDNLVDHLRVEQVGDRLSIGLEPYKSYRQIIFSVDVSMPDISKLDLSGGSDGKLNGFNLNHDLDIQLSGGSELSGHVIAEEINFSLSGGSEVSVLGDAATTRIDGSGGSWFGLDEFYAQELEFDLSGGSTAKVNVNGTLSGSASGGSSVHYIGEAKLGNISKSGGARVSKQ